MDNDLRPTIAALTDAIRASLRAMMADLGRIERGERVSIGTVVKEADVLSGCCARLDKLLDRVPVENAPKPVDPRAAPPVEISKMTELLRRLRAIAAGDVCPDCGCPHPA